jgi:hypothetical protein
MAIDQRPKRPGLNPRTAVFSAFCMLLMATFTQGSNQTTGDTGDLVALGFLPVTFFGAHPDDNIDDTRSIQRAIDEALERRLVVFFPSGTYLVSDTLRASQPVSRPGNKEGQWAQDRRQANVLLGSTNGDRPVLRLSDQAQGFDDPDHPKTLVRIWAQPRDSEHAGSTKPEHEQPNISFNQCFTGIDIDLRAPRNRGAVGIQHTGSQGSMLSDVTIRADGAYAGIINPPGQGGGVYNVEVIGGRFGIWADHRTRYPVMAGVTLTAQSGPSLYWKGQSNLTLAGFKIDRGDRIDTPAILLEARPQAFNGALTLIDGVLRTNGGRAIENTGARSVYARDLYLHGSSEIVKSGNRPPLTSGTTGWTHVSEYGFAPSGADVVIDGVVSTDAGQFATFEHRNDGPDEDRLINRHVWADAPSFEDAETRSVIEFGAVPNDGKDDTAAFSSALHAAEKVFVPKGVFDLSETLRIPRDRHLFGAGKHLSILRASRLWKGSASTAVVTTDDDRSASTSISSLMIENDSDQHLTLLEWRAGRDAVIRDVMGAQVAFRRSSTPGVAPTYLITGSGGGRWFGIAAEWNAMRNGTRADSYRHLLIDQIAGPLALYGVNVERAFANPQSEIRNTENVSIYYLKGETVENQNPGSAIMRVNGSRNIRIFGVSGNAKPIANSFISLVDSADILVANVAPVSPSDRFVTLTESVGGTVVRIPGSRVVTVLKRNVKDQ